MQVYLSVGLAILGKYFVNCNDPEKWIEALKYSFKFSNGKYELDGNNVYAMVQSYETLKEEELKFEAHREYIDLQFVAGGKEIIKWTNTTALTPCTQYNEGKDYILYEEHEGTCIKLKDGWFTILLPDDAHKPKCVWEQSETIKKIVVKIKVRGEK